MNATDTINLLKNLSPDISVLLIAKHGVGKSSIVKQVAASIGQFHDVRLSQCEVGDIKGLPVLNHETKTTDFFKPYWWPRDMDSKGVLFFDELNRASNEVLQSVFEVCLDRRLDGDVLPSGWRVVAAINGSDDYQVAELDPALLDRWFVIEFEPTIKEWCAYAKTIGVHEAVREFVLQDGKRLDPPEGCMEPGKVYPSRRSWVRFDEQMRKMGAWESEDERTISQLAAGFLGFEISVSFVSWFKSQYETVRPEDVLNKYNTTKKVRSSIARLKLEIGDISSFANSFGDLILSKKRITDKQFGNFKVFFKDLPAEPASSLWSQVVRSDVFHKKVTSDKSKFIEYVASLHTNYEY